MALPVVPAPGGGLQFTNLEVLEGLVTDLLPKQVIIR